MASTTAVAVSTRPPRRDLRLLRRLRRASALVGPGLGSAAGTPVAPGIGSLTKAGAAAEAGMPQPGQDSAPLRWRRQGAQ
ncbi:hypothetical protein [Kitasatospora sp. GP82]|uniref:hypothetical protein n=1 Tax=Kitasatospora sp. GP82 TaxID=3035089 RepID=UPI002473EBEA|nr:hypothetical protein [Kitasatospora sp. GP82]MDH6128091.1 hypothetical protein [Kitasatospora sp. GP82]